VIDWPNMTLEQKMEAARKDDICDQIVPSDVRMLLAEISSLRERNAKLDRFARLMMKTLEKIEECSDLPEHITDSVADILADWSEE